MLESIDLSQLPLPVASAVERARSESDFARTEHLLRAFDRTLRLASAVVCADYFQQLEGGAERSPTLDVLLTTLARPSLGHWLAIARDGAAELKRRERSPSVSSSPSSPSMLAELFRTQRDNVSRIVALRNVRIHAEDDSVEPELQHLVVVFLESLVRVQPFADLVSGERDLPPILVLEDGDGARELLLFHGRHRKRGTLLYMPSSRGGTVGIRKPAVEADLRSRIELLVSREAGPYRSASVASQDSPFRKLRAFAVEDADLFFGRDVVIADVCDAVDTVGLTVLHGASGTGKTSLLRAGIRPALEDAYVWLHVDATSDLLSSLESCARRELAQREPNAPATTAEPAVEIISRLARRAGRPVLIVVDPLEEVFHERTAESADRLARFASILSDLTTRNLARILLSLRSDFLADLERLKEAGVEDIFRNTVELRALDPSGARAALVEPFAAAGLALPRSLAERIVRELGVGGDAVSAVELSIVGDALFERARAAGVLEGRSAAPAIVDISLYESMGGAGNVLSQYVRGALEAVDDPVGARQLLEVMLAPAGFRQPAMSVDTIVERSLVNRPKAAALLDRLVTDRILQTTAGPRYRIAHDLVAREVFSQLEDEQQANLEIREALESAARAWDKQGRPPRGFPSERQLSYFDRASGVSSTASEFLAAARRAAVRRRRIERGFIALLALVAVTASVAAVTALRARNEAVRSKDAAREAQRASSIALRDGLAAQARIMAEGTTKRDALIAALRALAIDADLGIEPGPVEQGALYSATFAARAWVEGGHVWEHGLEVLSVAVAPDGVRVATASADGLVAVHDGRSGALAFERTYPASRMRGSREARPEWSPLNVYYPGIRDRLLVGRGEGGRLGTSHELLDARGAPAASPWLWADGPGATAPAPNVSAETQLWSKPPLSLSADAELLAGVGFPGLPFNIVVSRTRDGTLKRDFGIKTPVLAVELSRDGARLLAVGRPWSAEELKAEPTITSSPGGANVWDVATGRVLRTVDETMETGALSPDGSAFVVGDVGGWLHFDDLEEKVAPWLWMHRTGVSAVRFSPDGAKVAVGTQSGEVFLRSATDGMLLDVLDMHRARVNAIAFSGDGRLVTTASDDHLAAVWPTTRERLVVPLDMGRKGPAASAILLDDARCAWFAPGAIRVAALSAMDRPQLLVTEGRPTSIHLADHGRILLAVEADAIRRWSLSNGAALPAIHRHAGSEVVVSPGGRSIAFENGRSADLLDLQEGRGLGGTLRHVDEYTTSSPDLERVLVATDHETELRVMATGAVIASFGPSSEAVFSPDGARICTENEGSRTLWDSLTGKPIAVLRSKEPDAIRDSTTASFTSDSRRLATHRGKNAMIWRAADGVLLATIKSSTMIDRLAISGDGARLATTTSDGIAEVWDVSTGVSLVRLKIPGRMNVGGDVRLALAKDGSVLLASGTDLSTAFDFSWKRHVALACSAVRAHRDFGAVQSVCPR